MTVIRMVSWIHGSWGATILALALLSLIVSPDDLKGAGLIVPRPFGSLEAYLIYTVYDGLTGLALLSTAILSSFVLRTAIDKPWIAVAGTVPQQLVLLWGAVWGLQAFGKSLFIGPVDIRVLIACEYLIPWTIYHGIAVKALWAAAVGSRDAK